MADALDLLENIEQLNLEAIAGDSLKVNSEKFVMFNRDQLWDGKLSTGEDLSPTYFDDPYFKTPEAAKRYSAWKDSITPNPKRKKGVPNLYITGAYHRSIELEVQKGEYEVRSLFKDAIKIEQKFTNEVYGLNEENSEKLVDEGLADSFYEKLHDATGL